MAEKGFKHKLTSTANTYAKLYSRLMYDPDEPMPKKLATYCTFITALAKQYRLKEFYWAVGCDEGNVEYSL